MEPRLDIASDEALRLAFDPPRLTPAEAEEIARREFGLEGRASPLPSERDQNFLLQAQRFSSSMPVMRITSTAGFADLRMSVRIRLQYSTGILERNLTR